MTDINTVLLTGLFLLTIISFVQISVNRRLLAELKENDAKLKLWLKRIDTSIELVLNVKESLAQESKKKIVVEPDAKKIEQDTKNLATNLAIDVPKQKSKRGPKVNKNGTPKPSDLLFPLSNTLELTHGEMVRAKEVDVETRVDNISYYPVRIRRVYNLRVSKYGKPITSTSIRAATVTCNDREEAIKCITNWRREGLIATGEELISKYGPESSEAVIETIDGKIGLSEVLSKLEAHILKLPEQ